MGLFDADCARDLADTYDNDSLEGFEDILDRIKFYAQRGNGFVTFFDVLKPEIRAYLMNRGFIVEVTKPEYIYESPVTRVSW